MAGSLPAFNLAGIADVNIRKNFDLLLSFLKTESPLLGFKHFELSFNDAIQGFEFRHNLGFQPSDVFTTFVSNSAVVTWSYDKFDSDKLVLSVDKGCTLRFFAGAYNPNP